MLFSEAQSTIPPATVLLADPLHEHPLSFCTHWFAAAVMVLVGVWAGVAQLVGGEVAFGAFWLVVAAAGALLGLEAHRGRGTKIVVYPRGLAMVGRGQTEVLSWEEISAVWRAVTVHYVNGVKTRTTHRYTVQARSGAQHVFTDRHAGVVELGEHVVREVSRRLMPACTSAYNQGQWVQFGQLSLSKAGIAYGSEILPWSEVERISMQSGQLQVRKKGKWLSWLTRAASEIPNLPVFLGIVDQVVGVR